MSEPKAPSSSGGGQSLNDPGVRDETIVASNRQTNDDDESAEIGNETDEGNSGLGPGSTIINYGPQAKTDDVSDETAIAFLIVIGGLIAGGIVAIHFNKLAIAIAIWAVTVIGGAVFYAVAEFLSPKVTTGALTSAGIDTQERELEEITIRLSRYQTLTRKQASRAFWVGQFASIVGFAILVLGGYVVVRQAQTSSAQIVVGGLSTLGAIVTTFISATFFRLYRQTQIQMNFYYAQPLVLSYILKADSLSRGLKDPAASDAVRSKIIDQTLEVAAVAAQLIKPESPDDVKPLRTRRNDGDDPVNRDRPCRDTPRNRSDAS